MFVEEITSFSREQLEMFQPRDDYQELLELILIFWGQEDAKDYVFRAPGEYALSRWIAKAIYFLKSGFFRVNSD